MPKSRGRAPRPPSRDAGAGCSTATGSDAGKVSMRASSSASSWRRRRSRSSRSASSRWRLCFASASMSVLPNAQPAEPERPMERPPFMQRALAVRLPARQSRPGSMCDAKHDDDLGWFGLVRLQVVVGVPAGKIDDLGRLDNPRFGRFGGLHDIEPVAVEEEGMFAEHVLELPNHGVVVWNGLALKLSQSSFDLFRGQFHRTLLS